MILQAIVKKDTIVKFVKQISAKRSSWKVVDVLRAVTICNDYPILKNQDILSGLLLDNSLSKLLLTVYKDKEF